MAAVRNVRLTSTPAVSFAQIAVIHDRVANGSNRPPSQFADGPEILGVNHTKMVFKVKIELCTRRARLTAITLTREDFNGDVGRKDALARAVPFTLLLAMT
jgi:hypothetical protein